MRISRLFSYPWYYEAASRLPSSFYRFLPFLSPAILAEIVRLPSVPSRLSLFLCSSRGCAQRRLMGVWFYYGITERAKPRIARLIVRIISPKRERRGDRGWNGVAGGGGDTERTHPSARTLLRVRPLPARGGVSRMPATPVGEGMGGGNEWATYMPLWAFIRGLHALTLPPPPLTPLPCVRKARTQARQLTSRCRNRTSLSSDVKWSCVRDHVTRAIPHGGIFRDEDLAGKGGPAFPFESRTRCWKTRRKFSIFEYSNCADTRVAMSMCIVPRQRRRSAVTLK